MICVTIGRGRHKSLLQEWKDAAAAGAPLVELRIDCLRSEPNLKRILQDRFTPVVFTIRRGADGGLWRGDEEKRLRLIREAIVLGVDYVDLESDVAPNVPRFGKTRRIVSHHDFRKTPEDLESLAAKLREAGADVVKIAAVTKTLGDASRLLDLMARATSPTVALGMGLPGFFTRILGAKFGAPLTYAGFNPDRTFAPGMPLLQDLRRDYNYDAIGRDTKIFAVIGDPIGHSLSPAIHNAAFRERGIDAVYVPIQVPAGQAKAALEELAWLDLAGLSVTIPHKEAVVPLLARADGAVEQTGACNTMVAGAGGWSGFNTDYRAAMGVLESAYGGDGGPGGDNPLLDKQALILGSGGVARTIAFGLARRGVGVTIAARNEEKAENLAAEVGCRFVAWTQRAGTPCDILVNGTPVGMHPAVDESPVPPAAFRPGMLCFDTVYHPENTMFLKLARERECKSATGVDMFIRQAALQFRHFTGQEAPVDLMREVVARKLGALRE